MSNEELALTMHVRSYQLIDYIMSSVMRVPKEEHALREMNTALRYALDAIDLPQNERPEE